MLASIAQLYDNPSPRGDWATHIMDRLKERYVTHELGRKRHFEHPVATYNAVIMSADFEKEDVTVIYT